MKRFEAGSSGSAGDSPGLPGFPADHPLRRMLVAELHARPPTPVTPPARLAHFALHTGETAADPERASLSAQCRKRGLTPPAADAKHFQIEFVEAGRTFGLTWERHTEFSTYTFCLKGRFDPARPFDLGEIEAASRAWMADVKGTLLVALAMAFIPRTEPRPGPDEISRIFGAERISGGEMVHGRAAMVTDFALDDAGRVRVLVHDQGLSGGEARRLVQRLLEIETYRMMALLALPLAREIAPKITEMEQRLGQLAVSLTRLQDVQDEQQLLLDLSSLAAEVELLAAKTPYRFGAARAYYDLLKRRIAELQETPIEGVVLVAEFMERRLSPAMQTCENVHARLTNLSARVTRTGGLLGTRVEVAVEQQNFQLLASMNRRADMQLRLQQTVEGLSVAAITYYAVGLIDHAAGAGVALGLELHRELVVGFSIPLVAGLAWYGVRRVRRWVSQAQPGS
jgi:uncharacterized membrane-anchored protein